MSLKSRQTPTLSLSVAPPVNRSYTELASAERTANTATVDFDTGCLQPDMSAPEEQTSTLAHATACTASVLLHVLTRPVDYLHSAFVVDTVMSTPFSLMLTSTGACKSEAYRWSDCDVVRVTLMPEMATADNTPSCPAANCCCSRTRVLRRRPASSSLSTSPLPPMSDKARDGTRQRTSTGCRRL